jgi:hypothetical protein
MAACRSSRRISVQLFPNRVVNRPPPNPDIVLSLRPLPVEGRWPAAVRFRALLKITLRRFRLKCVRLSEPRTNNGPQEETRPQA